MAIFSVYHKLVWKSCLSQPSSKQTIFLGTAVNFYPSAPLLAKAYWEIIDKWQWKTFTVLYEDDESLLRLSELIITAKNEGIVVTVEQLDREGSGSYRYF